MSIPDYQAFMLPFLRILGDQKEHKMQEMYKYLSDHFQLTEEDRQELLPSGKQLKYKNRIGWARTYLKKAGLLQQPGRGRFIITEQGLEVLKEDLEEINVKYLSRFSSFQEFRNQKNSGSEISTKEYSLSSEGEKNESTQTPEEVLESSYLELRKNLADDLVEIIKTCSPSFFESLVVDLLVAMGYGGSRLDAGQIIGKSGDEGIDGIIKEDKLGLDILYIQAKRWGNPVGRPVVQAFAGSLEGQRARKGILITTSTYTQGALEYVKNIEKKIVLIDGKYLADLMIDYNIGVSKKEAYILKQIDHDYFEEH